MSKIIYKAESQNFKWSFVLPWLIIKDLYRHRLMIRTMTVRDFHSAYQASYLGLMWQILLPLIMLAIYYFIIGKVLGGRFLPIGDEGPLDFALALFIGLAFFNTFAQSLGSASNLIISNVTYVKTLSFPLEVLPLVASINSLINLFISICITMLVLLFSRGGLPLSAILMPIYILSLFLLILGVMYGISALAVFFRDITPIMSPLILLLMFICPIFYPMSMVPVNLRWLMMLNPLAIIIEDARGCLLGGLWPSSGGLSALFVVSITVFVSGFYFFMRAKPAFSDVM